MPRSGCEATAWALHDSGSLFTQPKPRPVTEPRALTIYRTDGKVDRKEPGAYWHRGEPNGPWDLVLVTPNGTILFVGNDARIDGADALHYMKSGEWHRLPEPPGPGEKVGDGV